MASKEEDLLDLLLKVAQEQGLCNLPYSKVMIYIGENELDLRKERYTFKVIGGEEMQGDGEQLIEVLEWLKQTLSLNKIDVINNF